MAVRVLSGWQVKHNGKMHRGGDTIEGARQAEVQKWLSAGWVEEVKESGSKEPESKPSASPSAKKTTTRGDA